ncbi:MAG: glycosyltransferase [Candidatus Latescibacterota bacterium]|nr:MAG: glycosyltransferase [Candidatus Latescibacterota bacterium]
MITSNPDSKIRVGVLVSTLPTGGAERVTFNVLTRLDPDKFESEVYFLKEPGTIGQSLLDHGIRGFSRIQRLRFDPFLIVRLTRRVRAFSPDVFLVLNCHRNAKFWGGLCSLFADTGAMVIAVHNTGTMNSKRSFNVIDRLFLASISSVIALSDSHARYIEHIDGFNPDRITIIENGIVPQVYENADAEKTRTLRHQLDIGQNDKIVMMVAGLRPEKAHEALIQAASILAPNRPEIKFLIVGDGPRREELERMTLTHKVQNSVVFLGERKDVSDLLHIADAVVLPSHPAVETLPLAVMEAMAAGVPVVASKVGSVPDMIEDGVNGRLISPADGEELAAVLVDLFDNESVARAIAAAAGRTVREKYTLDRMVSKYASLFERLARRD